VAVSGDDVSGYATITVGTSPAAGVLATVNFANAYLTNPKVQITPGDAASAVAAGGNNQRHDALGRRFRRRVDKSAERHHQRDRRCALRPGAVLR
jgi:hypothetical protein